MGGPTKYMNSGGGWVGELFVSFIAGFVLATLLWLGLWLFQARPAQAAALQAQETELHQCLATKELADGLREKVQAENEEISSKLDQALAGWGRCIRSQAQPQAAAATE